jgi:hypothetical protein
VLQRLWKSDTDLAIRGDGDGEIAERFITGAIRGDSIPGRVPFVAPLRCGHACGVEVMASLGQPSAALDDPDPILRPLSVHTGQLAT